MLKKVVIVASSAATFLCLFVAVRAYVFRTHSPPKPGPYDDEFFDLTDEYYS